MVRSEDLSGEQRAVLDAIVAGKLAWSSEIEITLHLGCLDPDELLRVLGEVVGLGLVVPWVLYGETQYTLTPWGAVALDVHILERTVIVGEELEEDPYWAETTQEPRSIHLPKRRHEIRWPWMDELPDPETVKRSGEVLCDEDGEPVTVLGMPVPVDPKLKGAKQSERKAG